MRYVMTISFDHPVDTLRAEQIRDVFDSIQVEDWHPYWVLVHQLRQYDSETRRVNNDSIRFVDETEELQNVRD